VIGQLFGCLQYARADCEPLEGDRGAYNMNDQDTLSDESVDTPSDESIDADTLSDEGMQEAIPVEDIPILDSIADRLRKQPAIIRILMFGAGALVGVLILLTIALLVADVRLMKFLHVYLCVGCFSLLVIGLCVVYDLVSRTVSLRDYQLDDIRQHNEVYNAARPEAKATAGIESGTGDRA
jgi:hypothetical protein